MHAAALQNLVEERNPLYYPPASEVSRGRYRHLYAGHGVFAEPPRRPGHPEHADTSRNAQHGHAHGHAHTQSCMPAQPATYNVASAFPPGTVLASEAANASVPLPTPPVGSSPLLSAPLSDRIPRSEAMAPAGHFDYAAPAPYDYYDYGAPYGHYDYAPEYAPEYYPVPMPMPDSYRDGRGRPYGGERGYRAPYPMPGDHSSGMGGHGPGRGGMPMRAGRGGMMGGFAPGPVVMGPSGPRILSRFKTKLCSYFMDSNGMFCPHGASCQFAHGVAELRVPGPPGSPSLPAPQDVMAAVSKALESHMDKKGVVPEAVSQAGTSPLHAPVAPGTHPWAPPASQAMVSTGLYDSTAYGSTAVQSGLPPLTDPLSAMDSLRGVLSLIESSDGESIVHGLRA